jgi:hypothetical protein
LITGAVIAVAAAAGLGNSPAPTLSLVRQDTVGRYPPKLSPTHFHMAVTLPQSRRWVALTFWRYAETEPLLQIHARSLARPLPRAITLSYGVPGVIADRYDIVKAKGDRSRSSLVNRTDPGWYAVLVEDDEGQRSVVFFETGQKVSRGYFSCSSEPRLVREDTARKLAPPDVQSHFSGLFSAVPRLRLAPLPPPATPPRKKSPAPPAAPPPVRRPRPSPPAGR